VQERIEESDVHFVKIVKDILQNEGKEAEGMPLVCAPFDTELFGHWWFEGPRWLYQTLKRLDQDAEIELMTGSEYLNQVSSHRVVSLPEGSWGEGGFHHIWFNEDTRWSWELIYDAEKKMVQAAQRWSTDPDPQVQDILKQLARELLLLESSDWQFLISTISARDYAETRLLGHHLDFERLYQLLEKITADQTPSDEDWEHYLMVSARDTCFPSIDPKWWKGEGLPGKQ